MFTEETTKEEILSSFNELTETNALHFWAPTHPQLCDPGMDWTVQRENKTLKYRIWWHEFFNEWTPITEDELADTLFKYRNGLALTIATCKNEEGLNCW